MRPWSFFCAVCSRAGVVTSMMDPDAAAHPFGLAYIRTKAGGVGLKVGACMIPAVLKDVRPVRMRRCGRVDGT